MRALRWTGYSRKLRPRPAAMASGCKRGRGRGWLAGGGSGGGTRLSGLGIRTAEIVKGKVALEEEQTSKG